MGALQEGQEEMPVGKVFKYRKKRKAITKTTSNTKTVVSQGPVCSLGAADLEPLRAG